VQTITIVQVASQRYSPGATVSAQATTSSGLALTVTTTGACGVLRQDSSTTWTLSLTGAGTCTVTATQGGNASYQPATARMSFTIS
jgi:hypothetical protein